MTAADPVEFILEIFINNKTKDGDNGEIKSC